MNSVARTVIGLVSGTTVGGPFGFGIEIVAVVLAGKITVACRVPSASVWADPRATWTVLALICTWVAWASKGTRTTSSVGASSWGLRIKERCAGM
ncbi:hypothetical protein [Polyangium sp. y55x31]|uniref:hypothetical protein n=1 Tax=Polyangium sp. y55x31 TaxID=3042688 RepID=UPI002482B918|nr:hypothetical protein [Polyangium sp. y55x31]